MKLVGLFLLSCGLLASASKLQAHHKLVAEGMRFSKTMRTMMYQKGQAIQSHAHKSFHLLKVACTAEQTGAILGAMGTGTGAPPDIAAMCAAGLSVCDLPAEMASLNMFCLEVNGELCFPKFMAAMSGGDDDDSTTTTTCDLTAKPCGCKEADDGGDPMDMTIFCTPCGRAILTLFADQMGGDSEDEYPNCAVAPEVAPDMGVLFDTICRKHSVTGKYCFEEFMALGETMEGDDPKMAPICSECIMPVMALIPATPGKDIAGMMADLCVNSGDGETCAAKFDGISATTIAALENCVGPDVAVSDVPTTCTCQTQYDGMLTSLGCCTERVLRISESDHPFDSATCTTDAQCDTSCEYSDYCLEICDTSKEACATAKPNLGQDKSSLPLYPKVHTLSVPFKTYLTGVCSLTIPADCAAAVEETVTLEFKISNLKPDYYAGLSGADKTAFDACIASKLGVAAGIPAGDITFTVVGDKVTDVGVKDVVGNGAASAIVANAPNLHFDCLATAAKVDASLDFEAEFEGGASTNFLSAITMATVFATFFLL